MRRRPPAPAPGRRRVWLAAGALLLATGGCTAEPAAGDAALEVVAAFYPLAYAAERVGGEQVAVDNLAPPGVEPHDLELTPSQVADIAGADVVIYLAGFQPAVDEAVAANADDTAVNAADSVPLLETAGNHGPDAHFWLDPDRLAGFATALAAEFGERDPDHADAYQANAAALADDLAALDQAYADGLADCERREIVVSHAAFGYLADRYQLTQIAVSGLTPEAEPSPQALAEVVDQARAHGATTIFFEVLVSPEVAQVIADEVGADTAVLDPIEGLAPDRTDDYLSLMRNNLATLRTALGCS
ncbi:MAG TPA: metal ABC transporter substrate-binding protein [Natronosporangium sp.]